jgi:hypothetical protein
VVLRICLMAKAFTSPSAETGLTSFTRVSSTDLQTVSREDHKLIMHVTVVLSKSPFMVQQIHATPEGRPVWIEVPNDPMYEEVSFRSTFSFRRVLIPLAVVFAGGGNSSGISLW